MPISRIGTDGIDQTSSQQIGGISVGRGSGFVATNTAVGVSALTGSGAYNTAVGYQALDANTTGNTLVAVGHNSLGANTSGAENTAVGQGSLQTNTTGSNNTAVGVAALSSNTSGGSNSAIGEFSLYSNTTASNNTVVGYQAGYSNTTDGSNTFIGRLAGYTYNANLSINTYNTFVGAEAGRYTTTGTINGFFGYGAGALVTTGSKNTILGSYNGNQGGLNITTTNNNIVLSDGDGNPRAWMSGGQWVWIASNNPSVSLNWDAAELYPTPDNAVKLGYPSYRWTTVYATTGTINTSDANQKQDIAALDDAEKRVATAIKSLIKKYRFRDAVSEKGDAARIHVGAVAQEVQAAFVAEGLDPARYALFCSDTWYEVDGKAKADDGNFYTAETEGAVEVTRLGLRYDELLAFVIAAL